MPPKPTNWGLWAKALVAGTIVGVGGPVLTMYLMPTEEELVSRYNPDLKKKSMERRHERQQEFDDFVTKLKEYSKSDKPIWTVQAEAEKKEKAAKILASVQAAEEAKTRQEEMRREAGLRPQARG